MNESTTQHGYLVIADISGYTSFVAGTELEHSHEILSDLLGTICDKIAVLLTIHKLEGDAVFAYAPESKISRGETLLELIESTYAAFRDKQVSMKRATTCTCRACQNIPSLDLKFVAHHGDYILQQVRNIKELVGSDVNLVHRLLKNHVTASTGWRAYMLFTEACLEHLQLALEEAHTQVEAYEHFDEIKTFSLDLHQQYQEMVEARRIFLNQDEADIVIIQDIKVPLLVAWEWIQDPVKRNQWGHDVAWTIGDRPQGRMGSGASNHCAHGGSTLTEVVLDWHPFEYSTTESLQNGKKIMTETFRFEPLPDDGTRVYDIMKMEISVPQPLRRLVGRVVSKMMHMEAALQEAARYAEADFEKTNSELYAWDAAPEA